MYSPETVLRSSCVALLFFALSIPGPAAAHGRLPATNGITFDRADDAHLVVRTTFGLLVSNDAGATFRWVCPDALGDAVAGRLLLTEDPAVAITEDGTIVAGFVAGIAHDSGGGCAFEESAGDLAVIVDVAIDPDDASRVYALTGRGGAPNGLYASDDHGRAFTAIDADVDEVVFNSLAISRTVGERIYLAGAPDGSLTEAFVYASRDRGRSFDKMPFALDADAQGVHLLGVDPSAPEIVYARIDGLVLDETLGSSRKADDRLARSDDGGATWTTVLTMRSIFGFATDERDSGTVWAGGDGGLYRSTDRGVTFTQVDRFLSVRCLAHRADALYVCADEFADGYSIGRSTNDGTSFSPLLSFRDVKGIVECADEPSPTRSSCERCVSDLVNDLMLDTSIAIADAGSCVLDGGPDGGDAGDAGLMGDPSGGGCDCGVAARQRSPGWLFMLVALLALTRRARASMLRA